VNEPADPQQRAGRRFGVALSFPGEKRAYVSRVASALQARTSVFYDADHEAQLARLDLDLYLQDIYRNQAELLVVFLCEDYSRNEWCSLEWRAIRNLIKMGERDRIMLMRFDDAIVEGLFSHDGCVDLRKHTPEEAADLICQRLSQLRGAGTPTSPPGLALGIQQANTREPPGETPGIEQETLIVRLPPPTGTRTGTDPASALRTSGLEVPLEGWLRSLAIDSNYQERHDRLVVSLINNEYEEAATQYWELLYYTGTRELWIDRAYLSERLLEMSERRGDHRTSGLILAKGQAWPLVYNRRAREARKALEKALAFSVRAKDRLGIALYHEYMADVASSSGNVRLADEHYLEARDLFQGAEAHKVELKRLFARSAHDDLGSRNRITALARLREDFGSLKSYMEGITQIELARSYLFLGAPEALITAEEAYSLLENDVKMPTSAAKAKALLERILKTRRGER